MTDRDKRDLRTCAVLLVVLGCVLWGYDTWQAHCPEDDDNCALAAVAP